MAEHVAEADHRSGGDMNPALAVVYISLSWLAYGVAVLLKNIAFALLWLLHLLYRPIAFTLQPVVYLGPFLLACLALPFKALVKFETLFIYLSVAAIVGVSSGLVISLLSKKITGTFLNSTPPPIKAKGRSAKDYRQQKQKQKFKDEVPTLMLSPSPQQVNGTSPHGYLSPGHISPGYASLSDGSRRRAGLHTTTILEEEDSEF